MLIIDKQKDIETLQSIGANRKTIRRIFIFEGWLITATGAIVGLIIGATLCILQIKLGFIQFPDTGTFIIKAYPVKMLMSDFLYVFGTVLLIGFAAAWYPAHKLTQHITL